MSKLQDQINALETQLNLLNASSENKEAIQEYVTIKNQLSPVYEVIKKQREYRMVLTGLPGENAVKNLNSEESKLLEEAINNFNNFLTLWSEIDFKARQDKSLNNAGKSIETLSKTLSSNNRRAWKEWVNILMDQFDTEQAILDSQKDIPRLQQNVQSYRVKRQEFIELAKDIPLESSSIGALEELANQLSGMRSKMVFDLPEEVKKFFEQINNVEYGFQYPLMSLTQEVKDWLIKNNELSNFVIKRRGMR